MTFFFIRIHWYIIHTWSRAPHRIMLWFNDYYKWAFKYAYSIFSKWIYRYICFFQFLSPACVHSQNILMIMTAMLMTIIMWAENKIIPRMATWSCYWISEIGHSILRSAIFLFLLLVAAAPFDIEIKYTISNSIAELQENLHGCLIHMICKEIILIILYEQQYWILYYFFPLKSKSLQFFVRIKSSIILWFFVYCVWSMNNNHNNEMLSYSNSNISSFFRLFFLRISANAVFWNATLKTDPSLSCFFFLSKKTKWAKLKR